MPRLLPRQTISDESQDAITGESRRALYGDGVLINGVDSQAARRAHMRAQTTARQVAERRAGAPLGLPRTAGQAERLTAARGREVEMSTSLAGIAAEHQVWLRAQGLRASEEPGTRALPTPSDT